MSPRVRITIGVIFLLLGVIGSLLPILQGWLFFLLGIFFLSRHVPLFARIANWLRSRFPKAAATADRLGMRIHRKGIGNILKSKLGKLDSLRPRKEFYLSKKQKIIGFIGWSFLCFGVAWAASLATPGEWYASLEKPPFNPPDWVFGLIWTILYALMAVAAWLVWKKKGFLRANIPMTLFFLQLGLNGVWPWLFFGFKLPGWAFLDIVVLWFALLLTLASFWIESPAAGALLVPYLAWISYAAVINYIIWRINT
jgi:tryptophan-rich sensory protein